jgi:adenylate cyclase
VTAPRKLRRRREVAILLVVIAAAAIGVVAYATHLMRALEQQSVDARFSVRGTQPRPSEFAVVEVDDHTFDELGVQWPFPRSLHARLIDRLREAGAKVIAVDIQFTEPSPPGHLWEDEALADSVERAGGVVLSTTEVNSHGESGILGGEEVMRELGARAANGVVIPDPGGVYRKMHYGIQGLVSFGVATAEATTGEPIGPSDMEGDGEAWIDFRGPPNTFAHYSYSRVLQGKVPASAFRGKTVIVGASAPTLQDVHPTSTSGNELMSGPEIQANAAWTAVHGFPLTSSGALVDLLLILLMAAAPAAATLRVKALPALLAALALGLVYAVATQVAFDAGTVLPVVYPLLALMLSALGALAVNYVINAFERQRVHDTFSRFVPAAVVSEVLARTDDDLRLGGERREATILFSDLRGFTSYSEQLAPDAVIDVLNRYLGEMSDAIMDHGGTLVAYMGDGIMAVFGAPLEQADHADRAVAAAREMLEVRLPQFNAWMEEAGMGRGFDMGIGLNTGTVMTGQVGSERRVEYTAIGDTTNTASRLEGMTKGTGHQAFIADSTRLALQNQVAELELVGEYEVRGRKEAITVWTLPTRGETGSGDDEEGGAEEEDQVEGLVDRDPQA